MKKLAAVLGAVLAAIAASACCILPALLGAGAAGSFGLGATLGAYRPHLLGLTLVLLAVAFYLTYRPARDSACETEVCENVKSRRIKRVNKTVLWIVTIFTLAVLGYPEFAAQRATVNAVSDTETPVASARYRAVVFTIGKMTCESCAMEIADALRKTMGVSDVKVDFGTRRASIRYQPSRVRVPELRAAIQRRGYDATQL